jgi:hypothetical protein
MIPPTVCTICPASPPIWLPTALTAAPGLCTRLPDTVPAVWNPPTTPLAPTTPAIVPPTLVIAPVAVSASFKTVPIFTGPLTFSGFC